jgi:hypothetical protein
MLKPIFTQVAVKANTQAGVPTMQGDDEPTAATIKPASGARQTPAWSADFAGSEHPDTARLRLQKGYIETITGLKRESIDLIYAYLQSLLEKAKEELVHARSASNDHRRALLQQHVDELIAYVAGHGMNPKLPTVYGDAKGAALANFYVIEEIPAFLGEVKFLIDLWYQQGLGRVHDEVSALIGLNRPSAPARNATAQGKLAA